MAFDRQSRPQAAVSDEVLADEHITGGGLVVVLLLTKEAVAFLGDFENAAGVDLFYLLVIGVGGLDW